eukprot:COSAG05_NODE_4762_length_1382_cov_0.801247_1_plen_44_part_10
MVAIWPRPKIGFDSSWWVHAFRIVFFNPVLDLTHTFMVHLHEVF